MACMYRVYVYNEVARFNDMYLVWADNAMDAEVKCKDRLDEETDGEDFNAILLCWKKRDARSATRSAWRSLCSRSSFWKSTSTTPMNFLEKLSARRLEMIL